MVLRKTNHTPYIENGPVQSGEIDESTRFKWFVGFVIIQVSSCLYVVDFLL